MFIAPVIQPVFFAWVEMYVIYFLRNKFFCSAFPLYRQAGFQSKDIFKYVVQFPSFISVLFRLELSSLSISNDDFILLNISLNHKQ
jgi:hypothetical protein